MNGLLGPLAVLFAATGALALRRPRAGILLSAAFLLQLGVVRILNASVDRPYGPIPAEMVTESAFPSPPTAAAGALVLALAWPWRTGWVAGVARVAVGLLLPVLLGALLVVGGVVYPVDAIAGLLVGFAAALAVGLATDERLRKSLAAQPLRPREPPPDLARGHSAIVERRL